MGKKIYDLSKLNQTQAERRILIADSGKEYDVSFRPAILNRTYYKRWVEAQAEIVNLLGEFYRIKQMIETNPDEVKPEDVDKTEVFTKSIKIASDVGMDLVIYAMKVNGYEEFCEEEALLNFTEESLTKAIDFIMGVEKDDKKKQKNKKANS